MAKDVTVIFVGTLLEEILNFRNIKQPDVEGERRMSSKVQINNINKNQDDNLNYTNIYSSTQAKDAGVLTTESSFPLSEDEVLRCNSCEFTSVYFSDMKRH